MAYIRYKIYPDDPDATAAARADAYGLYILGLIVGGGSIASLVYYISTIASLIKNGLSLKLLYSVVFLVAMAVIDFFVVFRGVKREVDGKAVKNYFLFFFGGVFALASIVSIIVLISNYATNNILLILSIGVLLSTILVVCAVYLNINKKGKLRFFTDKEELKNALLEQETCNNKLSVNAINDCTSAPSVTSYQVKHQYIYCHKCGKRTDNDSVFCSSCGTKLIDH